MSQSKQRRDQLIANEKAIQNATIFHPSPDPTKPKFFVTFPYPYMNGTLHLGHAYTICSAEFMARFKMLQGFNVLFPFAFHGTGMPIVASANRLASDLAKHTAEEVYPKNSQADILLKMGILEEDLPNFVDPYHWIKYFPEVARQDLATLGTCIDFSRSFMTTDANPYYDNFIRWQFRLLNKRNHLSFGQKNVIYSPLDRQTCSEADRVVGLDVGIKEHLMVKFPVVGEDNMYVLAMVPRSDVFKHVATRLTVTDEVYSLFEHKGTIYVCRNETLRNLRYQGSAKQAERALTGQPGGFDECTDIGTFTAEQLCEKSVVHPITKEQMSIKKGIVKNSTGISVHHSKPEFEMYQIGIHEKQINLEQLSEREVAILSIQETGMEKGVKKATEELCQTDFAFTYYEPEDIVVSRSGDTCVVALVDQWFIDYGQAEYKDKVNEYIGQSENGLNTYNHVTKGMFEYASNWLTQWPMSRSKGLGTKLLDTEYLIDSLSDSTIYMAYYTVAHLIEQLPLELLTDDVWSYLLLGEPCDLAHVGANHVALIEKMRAEFSYWYPVDLRVSGKDLVCNHLTMCLYNHAFIWPNSQMWPKSIFANGHVMLNGQKMSKSTGNFMTMRDAVTQYGADATRLALAVSGSSTDDANFTDSNADNAVLKLSTELDWCYEIIDAISESTDEDNQDSPSFWDTVFLTEMDKCVIDATNCMEKMEFQQYVVNGFYAILGCRDRYRVGYQQGFIKRSVSTLRRYLERVTALIYPVCPHWSSTVWAYCDSKGVHLEKTYPTVGPIDYHIMWLRDGFNKLLCDVRGNFHSIMKRAKKGSSFSIDVANLKLAITVHDGYSDEELCVAKHIRDHYVKDVTTFDELVGPVVAKAEKSKKGTISKFARLVFTNVITYGPNWFDFVTTGRTDEFDLVRRWLPVMLKELNIKEIDIIMVKGDAQTAFKVGPGFPSHKFV